MNFSSDAMADFEGLLEVNRKICKQQMAEKASPISGRAAREKEPAALMYNGKKEPRRAYIDEVWSNLKPSNRPYGDD